MKLACASSAFHRLIECGDLTQLEFVDLCARDITADGIVLDVRHFPRADDDYLAQIKQLTTDRGLTIAALADATFFGSDDARMREVLHLAIAVGAPIVAGPLARELDTTWSEQLARLSVATAAAKSANVTLAVRNAPGTFAPSTHDYKRVAKEADSAWLRFGPEPQALEAGSDADALETNSVLLWSQAGQQTERSINDTIAAFATFRGHVAIDESSGIAAVAQIREALHAWRTAIALQELNRT